MLVVIGADVCPDDVAGVLTETRGLEAGAGGLGVRVRVEGHHLVPDEVLDEAQGAAGRGVVGVGDAAKSERPHHRLVGADHEATVKN